MTRRHTRLALAFAPALALAAGAAGAGGLVELEFDLANFSTPTVIDNDYWPLAEGTTFVYFEQTDDECIVNDFVVTSMVKNDFAGDYAGITARVVSDKEWLDLDCDGGRDRLLEDTFDWYGQDDAGNIWYFGEFTTAYEYDEDGNFLGSDNEGSFEAGVDGAEAGLVMLAEPAVGLFYHQEFYEDEAEDMGKVLRVGTVVEIGLGVFEGCIVTKDWNPLEPGAVEHKHYCPPIGLVRIDELSGGPTVRVEAVQIELH